MASANTQRARFSFTFWSMPMTARVPISRYGVGMLNYGAVGAFNVQYAPN
jgi:hypothetical protein